MASANPRSNNKVVDILTATGRAIGAVLEVPEANRPLGVVYAKCFLRYVTTGLWAGGVAYIVEQFRANPEQMKNIFQNIALPAGVLLTGMSRGCLKLSLQADSLSSLKELWKRFTEGVLQDALTQALLTPDLLRSAEEGKKVVLEVQIDKRIYREACLDLMVKSLIEAHQDGRNASLSRRRCQSESNINLLLNASHSLDKLPLEAKSKKERQELKKEENEGKQETQPKTSSQVRNWQPPSLPTVLFSTIDEETVSQKTMAGVSEKPGEITGKVEMLAESNRPISDIKVHVFHDSTVHDTCKQKLNVTFGGDKDFKKCFSIDIDDIKAELPSMMYLKRRNMFKLSAVLYFTDGKKSEEFFSKPFYIPFYPHEFTHSEVDALVCDSVLALHVKKGTMTPMKPKDFTAAKSKETSSTCSKVCADLVKAHTIVAQTITYETLFPAQDFGRFSKPEEDFWAKVDDPVKHAKKSTSSVTVPSIRVKRLVVRDLTYYKLHDLV